jgi:hypothetical protein
MNKASKDELRQELTGLGSSLPSGVKGSPFRVPDHFFDQLPQAIQERIAVQRKSRMELVYALVPRRMAIAMVSLVLLFVLSFGLFFIQKGTEEGILIGAEDDFPELFFSLYADLDPYIWYEMVLETDITAEELYFGLNGLQADPDEEAFMDYLYEKVQTFELGAGDYIFP